MNKIKEKIERISRNLMIDLQTFVDLDWPCSELKGKYTINDLEEIIAAMKEVQILKGKEEEIDPFLKACKAIRDYADCTEDDDDKLAGLQELLNVVEDELECLP